jgi:hypothetical protein
MERDCYPQGILQRQVVHQITQISWKLRRIPAIEASLLKYHNLRGYKEFEQAQEDGSIPEGNELIQPTAEELIAMQFADPHDRPYERLELYRMRLERGLDSATKMLERLRKQTAGAELSRHQKVEYEKTDMNRVIEGYRESEAQRLAMERTAAENEAKDVKEPDGNSKPAKEMQNDNCAVTIKATTPSHLYSGERAGERGENRSTASDAICQTASLTPFPNSLP